MKCDIQGIRFGALIRANQGHVSPFDVWMLHSNNQLRMNFRYRMVSCMISLVFNSKTGKFERILQGEEHAVARCLRDVHTEYLELLAKMYLAHHKFLVAPQDWYSLPGKPDALFRFAKAKRANEVLAQVFARGIRGYLSFNSETGSFNSFTKTEVRHGAKVSDLIRLWEDDPHQYFEGIIVFSKRFLN